MANGFIINEKDDVITVTEPIEKGNSICFILGDKECSITAIDDIPKYHKAAIREVKCGEYVVKYGERIGVATNDIHVGNHVHTQNLADAPREEVIK